MGRPPIDNPRLQHITVRLSDDERAVLDRKRGGRNVGEFVRALIAKSRAS